ncbi:MAG: hypothetical protein CMJ28_04625 [Phycisphaerae bacterium]|nr:hypothetical protein [Phycisphaerae bacterium]
MRSSRIKGGLSIPGVRLDLVASIPPRILDQYRKLDAERLDRAAVRREALRSRVRRLLLAAAALSVVTHVLLLLYRYQIDQVEAPPEAIAFRFALEASDEALVSTGPDFEELLPGLDALELEPTDTAPAMTSALPAAPVPIGGSAAPSLGGAGAGAGAGSGFGSGSGLGGGGATFFGLAAEGRRFVYIVDKSGSMSTMWNAQPGNLSVGRSSGDTRWRRAVAELFKSIAALPTVARFQAYLYDSGLSSPPWNEDWVSAGARGRSRVQNWVDRMTPGGGTQPVDAIQSALRLQPSPDAIFLLTDGEFPVEPALQVLQSMKEKGVRCPVHTVALGSQAGADTLREISRVTGGRTRLVK